MKGVKLEISPSEVVIPRNSNVDQITSDLFAMIINEINLVGFHVAYAKNTISNNRKKYSVTPTLTRYEGYLLSICAKFAGMTEREYIEKAIRNQLKRTLLQIKIE